ncbi:hypothetical protein GOQ27_15155 [Clostridium sp. D2Q-11]|uniref:Uncharacterized protein n=1 Tax=Anaeromonas frigoriresistens TaxID=2683708 RepID=A0A942Z7R3_9FIRM|nr:hypothetical protein [Anaeromonas frigoriresistens]MBS4539811.1 hypothetical protein [Anaeromonas frigoriresistens]
MELDIHYLTGFIKYGWKMDEIQDMKSKDLEVLISEFKEDNYIKKLKFKVLKGIIDEYEEFKDGVEREYKEKEEVLLNLGFMSKEEAIKKGILYPKNEEVGYVRKLNNGALHILPLDYLVNKTIDEIYKNFYESNREINNTFS